MYGPVYQRSLQLHMEPLGSKLKDLRHSLKEAPVKKNITHRLEVNGED